MRKVANFQEVRAVLAEFMPSELTKTKSYTQDRIKALMAFLDNPQDQLKIIHVAGTSGKSSTSYYAAALLRSVGKKVGLTVSPHVAEVNERVQINLVPLPELEFCAEFSTFLALIDASRVQPSYFELLVAFAYWHFFRQKVDYAVIEVGLGGLKDATNVVSRTDKVCIITDIGFDHVNVLGHTLHDIAEQKAGIIQPENQVFFYRQDDEVINTIKKRVQQQHAGLHIVDSRTLNNQVGFLPLFQQRNFGLARLSVDHILKRDYGVELTDAEVEKAAHVHIPARMEIFKQDDKTIILDGGHNAQKLNTLIKSIKAQFPHQPVASLVSFGVGREYELAASLKEIISLSKSIIVTTFQMDQDYHHKAVNPQIIMATCQQQGFSAVEAILNPKEAFLALLQRPEPLLLVAGSFYLLNPIRPLMLKA